MQKVTRDMAQLITKFLVVNLMYAAVVLCVRTLKVPIIERMATFWHSHIRFEICM